MRLIGGTMRKLYTYFRSSAAFRVRIALNLKGLEYDAIPIHLVKDGGQQLLPQYRAVNPAGLVPALDDDGALITQSTAIIEYLEETHPDPALLPSHAVARAEVRALALTIACEIHPINNLRVLKRLVSQFNASEDQKNDWYRHWVETGLGDVEALLIRSGKAGQFCHGDTPGMADCFLLPQIFNARRFNCSLAHVPTINRIVESCEAHEAFQRAMPAAQPDAE